MRKEELTVEMAIAMTRIPGPKLSLEVVELGALACETKDPKAISRLCELLTDQDSDARLAAYGYLASSFKDLLEVQQALDAFLARPENDKIVKELKGILSGNFSDGWSNR